jgi:hypothetical protein
MRMALTPRGQEADTSAVCGGIAQFHGSPREEGSVEAAPKRGPGASTIRGEVDGRAHTRGTLETEGVA